MRTTDSAPAMRLSIDTRNLTPSFSAMSCASFIMRAASSRVSANWQMSTSVAWVSALIGLKERLPHALSQISERMSSSTRDLSPAFTKVSCRDFARSVVLPSSSPIAETVSPTWWITPGEVTAAPRIDDAAHEPIGGIFFVSTPVGSRLSSFWLSYLPPSFWKYHQGKHSAP